MARVQMLLEPGKSFTGALKQDARFAIDVGAFKDGVAYVTSTAATGSPTINFLTAVEQTDDDSR